MGGTQWALGASCGAVQSISGLNLTLPPLFSSPSGKDEGADPGGGIRHAIAAPDPQHPEAAGGILQQTHPVAPGGGLGKGKVQHNCRGWWWCVAEGHRYDTLFSETFYFFAHKHADKAGRGTSNTVKVTV